MLQTVDHRIERLGERPELVLWTLVVDPLAEVRSRDLGSGVRDVAYRPEHHPREDITSDSRCEGQPNDAHQRPPAKAVEVFGVNAVFSLADKERQGDGTPVRAINRAAGPRLHFECVVRKDRDVHDGRLVEAYVEV